MNQGCDSRVPVREREGLDSTSAVGTRMNRTAWAWARLRASPRCSRSCSGAWARARSSTASGRRRHGAGRRGGLGVLTTVCCAWRWKLVAPRSRRRPAASRRGGGVLPLAVPQRHAARRGRRRRPPRGQPRPRRQRRRPRAAGRRLGALRRPGRAGGRSTVAVLLALPSPVRSLDAAGRGRGSSLAAVAVVLVAPGAPGGGRSRLGAVARRAWPATSATGCSRGGPGSASSSPRRWPSPATRPPSDRRAHRRRRRRRCRGCCRWRCSCCWPWCCPNVAGWGPREGVDGVGVRRGRAGRGAGRRHRRRVRRDGVRREPARRRRPRGGLAPPARLPGAGAAAPGRARSRAHRDGAAHA